jgi:hypothetical protein
VLLKELLLLTELTAVPTFSGPYRLLTPEEIGILKYVYEAT